MLFVGTNMAPFDQEFHIALGVGVGGNADFPDGSRTGLSKTLKPWVSLKIKYITIIIIDFYYFDINT